MRSAKAITGLAATALLLAGCDQQNAPTNGDDVDTANEVLPGSISDDMLPLDTLQSQAEKVKPSADEAGTQTSDRSAQSARETADEAEESAPEEAANVPDALTDEAGTESDDAQTESAEGDTE